MGKFVLIARQKSKCILPTIYPTTFAVGKRTRGTPLDVLNSIMRFRKKSCRSWHKNGQKVGVILDKNIYSAITQYNSTISQTLKKEQFQ